MLSIQRGSPRSGRQYFRRGWSVPTYSADKRRAEPVLQDDSVRRPATMRPIHLFRPFGHGVRFEWLRPHETRFWWLPERWMNRNCGARPGGRFRRIFCLNRAKLAAKWGADQPRAHRWQIGFGRAAHAFPRRIPKWLLCRVQSCRPSAPQASQSGRPRSDGSRSSLCQSVAAVL